MSIGTRMTWENQVCESSKAALEDILRHGARQMLQKAIEAEVADYIEANKDAVDERTGRRMVVRNGRLPGREIQSGLGPIPISQPRVNDRREGMKFTSSILPPYMRRVPSIEALISVLYLKGVSTSDFPEALKAILGEKAAGLSASTIVRLKEVWQAEYEAWARRDLSARQYVYFWVDGIYFNVRLSDDRPCLLVVMGATQDGVKELVGLWDGERESKLSWLEFLRDLKRRGLQRGPALCVGDGALGFWAAVREVFPGSREQRCSRPQDGQRPGQYAQEGAAGGQAAPTGNLHGGDPEGGLGGVGRVHGTIRRQVSEGVRAPGQGQGRALHVLRLPGRTLDTPAHDQSD